MCKRDKVGDGRECESVRESRLWQREPIRDGREEEEWGDKSVCIYESERVGDGGEKVGSGRGSGIERERGNGSVCKRETK